MFERKNQGVLAPHFSALVTHDGADDADDDDGFLTLKQRDHTLQDVGLIDETTGEPSTSMTSAEMLSKRKLKQGESRKAMLKTKSSGHKVVFDDEGGAHEMYEMEGEDDFAKRGDAETQRQEYLEKNREVMKEADVEDRRVAREKRQEKKRKRKDREREEVSVSGSPDHSIEVADLLDRLSFTARSRRWQRRGRLWCSAGRSIRCVLRVRRRSTTCQEEQICSSGGQEGGCRWRGRRGFGLASLARSLREQYGGCPFIDFCCTRSIVDLLMRGYCISIITLPIFLSR